MKEWNSPTGNWKLIRHPFQGQRSHQAWDAADQILVKRVLDRPNWDQGKYLILNDAFGALSVSLGAATLCSVSDSCGSLDAQKRNRELNIKSLSSPLPDTERFHQNDVLWEPGGEWDSVLIKIPRSLGLLAQELASLNRGLPGGTPVILSGMSKDISKGTFELAQMALKECVVSQAEGKARIISGHTQKIWEFCQYPKTWEMEELGFIMEDHGGVFSKGKLDPGTRFFLRYFPSLGKEKVIVDLGCGNGVLGLAAARRNEKAMVYMADDSFMAVDSARKAFSHNGLEGRGVFRATNLLEGLDDEFADLVLCNPPFHFQNIQTTEVAEGMFREANRVLREGGSFWMVGNNHLGYHKLLDQFFPEVKLVKLGEKYVVLKAHKITADPHF